MRKMGTALYSKLIQTQSIKQMQKDDWGLCGACNKKPNHFKECCHFNPMNSNNKLQEDDKATRFVHELIAQAFQQS